MQCFAGGVEGEVPKKLKIYLTLCKDNEKSWPFSSGLYMNIFSSAGLFRIYVESAAKSSGPLEVKG